MTSGEVPLPVTLYIVWLRVSLEALVELDVPLLVGVLLDGCEC